MLEERRHILMNEPALCRLGGCSCSLLLERLWRALSGLSLENMEGDVTVIIDMNET